MRIFRIALILMMLFIGAGRVRAQMTDEQIIEYVRSAQNAGKSEQQISRELLVRGVRVGQIQQLRARLGVVADAGSADRSDAAQQAATRLRDGGDGDLDSQSPDEFVAGEAYGESPVTPLEDVAAAKDFKSIYGHQIFNSPALSFEPNNNLPTPGNYKLGPGDEVVIDMWGVNEVELRQEISPEGDIMISQIGPIYLSGLTISEASAKIRGVLSRKYDGVAGDEPVSDIRVSLGRLRTIRVNVMGEVATPGTFRMSSFATLFHALYNAGGITPIGSLRNIKVIRNGRTVAVADIYEYLFEGRQSVDIRLQEDDVVIVPPYDILVDVEGEFKRPVYYELKAGETLSDLIGYAGGFTGEAYAGELSVVRTTSRSHMMLTVPESDYSSIKLENGDVVTAGAILGRFDNRVDISGAVYRPGAYELSDRVSTVRRLVAAADGVTDDAFLTRALLTRKNSDYSFETISLDLKGILDGSAADVALMPDDEIFIPSTYSIENRGNLTVRGLVAQPGEYPFADNTSIEDLILRAGGLLDGASTVKIEVARRRKNPSSTEESGALVETILLDMNNGYAVGKGEKFILEPFDVVSVRRSPAYQTQRNVSIDGEVLFAGEYSLIQKNERLSDLVARAGGVTSDAYTHGARLLRRMNDDEKAMRDAMVRMAARSVGRDSVSVESLFLDDVFTVGIELDKALENPGSDFDLVLREGDRLIVPEMVNTVRVNGAVMYPNTVLYQKGRKLKHYVSQSGGYGNRAKRNRAYVVYMNGTVSNVRAGKGASMIEPGCEIVVPLRGERKGIRIAEAMAITSSVAALSSMGISISNAIRR